MLSTERVIAESPESRRLMVVLHGLGDSMEGYRWLPAAMRDPGLHFLLVNAPDRYYGGYSWYDIYGDSDPGIERSRGELAGVLDRAREFGFPSEETVVFGFSQGCLMAMEMACRYPHQLAAVVGISGYVHEVDKVVGELSPVAREQRVLVTHGTEDPLLPVTRIRRDVEVLKQAGMNIAYHEFPKPHTIAGELEMKLVREFVAECYV